MKKIPWVAVAVAAVGLCILVGLHVVEGYVSSRDAEIRAAIQAELNSRAPFHALIETLADSQRVYRERESAALRDADRLRQALARIDRSRAEEERAVRASPVDSLLLELPLQRISATRYATDSAGVVALSLMRLRLLSADSLNVVLTQLTERQEEAISLAHIQLRFAEARADSALNQLARTDSLLEAALELGTCHIDPFKLIPCPSPAVSFLLGAGAAVAVVVAVN